MMHFGNVLVRRDEINKFSFRDFQEPKFSQTYISKLLPIAPCGIIKLIFMKYLDL